MRFNKVIKLFTFSIVLLIAIWGWLYAKTQVTSPITYIVSSNKELTLDTNDNINVHTLPQLDIKVYTIDLPLAQEDYYEGKFINAKAGVNEINFKLGILQPNDTVRLVGNGIITLDASQGYITSEKGYGFGVCWAVTTLAGLIDKINQDFINTCGVPLFVITESHPHSHWYKTYFPNNGYGYAIAIYGPNNYSDYAFTINKEYSTRIKAIYFNLYATEQSAIGYKGQSIGGKATIVFYSK